MRLEGIDFLRGIAVSLVVTYHFFVILGLNNSSYFKYIHSFGLLGVSLFFIISGYLIYRSAAFSFDKYGTKSGLKHYIYHRVFRILPAYYFNLMVVLMLATFVINSEYFHSGSFLRQIFAHLTFSSYFIYQDSGFGINGAYWTLNIEMLWYIIVPLLVIFIKNKYTFLLIGILSFLYLILLDLGLFDSVLNLDKNSSSYKVKLYYLSFQLPGQISYFISGIFIYKYAKKNLYLTDNNKYIFSFLLIILFIYISSTYITPNTSFFLNNLFILSISSILFILLYNSKPKGVKWIEWLGKISYSLYLWHMPLLFVINKSLILTHHNLFNVIIIFILSLLIISSFSYYLIEEGGFNLRKKLEEKIKKSSTL